MIAAHLENLIFLLLIAVALLFQLLSRAASKASRDQTEGTSTPTPPTPPPVPRARPETDEERIRKFLEALGQPPTSRPPPAVIPRADFPPRPLAPVQPPTVHFPPPWKPAREERRKPDVIPRETPSPTSAQRGEKILPPAITRAPAFEVHEGPFPRKQAPIIKAPVEAYAAVTRPVVKGADFKTDIATILASRSGLRDAIILREIFGPPRGLQALDTIGT